MYFRETNISYPFTRRKKKPSKNPAEGDTYLGEPDFRRNILRLSSVLKCNPSNRLEEADSNVSLPSVPLVFCLWSGSLTLKSLKPSQRIKVPVLEEGPINYPHLTAVHLHFLSPQFIQLHITSRHLKTFQLTSPQLKSL